MKPFRREERQKPDRQKHYTVPELAKIIGMNERTLYRKARKASGSFGDGVAIIDGVRYLCIDTKTEMLMQLDLFHLLSEVVENNYVCSECCETMKQVLDKCKC